MEDLKCLSNREHAAFVFVAFLQADCASSERNPEYCNELLSLEKRLNLAPDVNCNNGSITNDGHLETDGHFPSRITVSLHDLQPLGLQLPAGGHAAAGALQEVAEELRFIAAQFQHDIMARATQNLRRNISASTSEQSKHHLLNEVNSVMKQLVGLENLPQERVWVALTLTLVKGVCEQTPRLLRNLFDTALQFICRPGGF